MTASLIGPVVTIPTPVHYGNDILAAKKDYGAAGNGIADDSAALANLFAAVSTGCRRFYLEAGTYRISTASILANLGSVSGSFQIRTSGVEIFGAGLERTFIQLDGGVNIGASNYNVFYALANFFSMSGITINGGTGWSGTGNATGIQVDTGSFYPRFLDMELATLYGGSGAGSTGIGLFQLWNAVEITGILGTGVSPGLQTVTPSSMEGIYNGRVISINDASPESVVASGVTRTTFQATFVNSHTSSAPFSLTSNGNQYGWIERCRVHNDQQGCAFGVNASRNVLRANFVSAVGGSGLQHGFYIQGGYNVVDGNYVQGCGGYGIHGHKAVPFIDSSGDRYVNNTVIDCGTGSIVTDFINSDGTNPEVPNGTPLNREIVIANNVLKNLKNGVQSLGISIAGGSNIQASIIGNVLEDAVTAGNSYILMNDTDCVVEGNVLRQVNQTSATNGINQTGNGKCTVRGNTFVNWNGNAINTQPDNIVDGNIIEFSATATANASVVVKSYCTIVNNKIVLNGAAFAFSFATGAVGWDVAQNKIAGSTSQSVADLADSTLAGAFHDNSASGTLYLRYDNGAIDLQIFNNDMRVQVQGFNATQPVRRRSALTFSPKTAFTIADIGYCLKTPGALALCAITDTTFYGVSSSSSGGTATDYYLVTSGEAWIQMDALWTAGHIAIVSPNTAGKFKDNGAVVPASPAGYCVLLDSGAGAGLARALIVRTLG